jgi:hypothetical protein
MSFENPHPWNEERINMSTDEPYIPLGFRTKPTPFTIHVGDAEYVFPQSFDIKPAMTKEEEATFHNALEAHMDKFIDFDTLKQIAVEPSWYTSFGQFIPADERKAKPNTERIFGEEYIQDKLDELRKQGYKVPESLSYARELLIDYDKLEKEDPPTSQSDPGSSKHPFWVDPLNEKGDEIPGNDRIDFNSLNQAGKREYEKRAALRIARRQVAEIVSQVSPVNTTQVMQEMTNAINHPSHYTPVQGCRGHRYYGAAQLQPR